TGKYDPNNHLRYEFGGFDLYTRLGKRVNLRAEFLQNPVDSLTQGYTKKGWWGQIDFPLGREMEFVATASGLEANPAQRLGKLTRYTLGLNRNLARTLKLKTEFAWLDLGKFIGDPTSSDDTRFG